jgi:hypothetical protein
VRASKAKYWNIWWTVSVIFMSLGILAGILEILGVFGDVGLVLTILGIGIGLYSAVTAATGSSLAFVREDIANFGEKLDTIGVVLGRMERGLARIERVLVERLPHETVMAPTLRERVPHRVPMTSGAFRAK